MYEHPIYDAIVQTYHVHGSYMFILFMKCINMYIPFLKFINMYIHGYTWYIHVYKFQSINMYIHGIYMVQTCMYMFIQV